MPAGIVLLYISTSGVRDAVVRAVFIARVNGAPGSPNPSSLSARAGRQNETDR